MSGKLCWVLALSAACGLPAGAGTIVDGNITTNITWTAAGSPYIIEKAIVEVRFGSTLTIDPGVEVRFQPGRVLETDGGCSIVAVGTAADTIVFTSNAPSPAPEDWGKVQVYNSTGSAFEHCVFSYAKTGLYMIESSPPVSYCSFRSCQRGLYCQRSSPSITHSSFTGSTWAAIQCYSRESLPSIEDSNLWSNEWNIYLQYYSGSEPEVTILAEGNWWGTDDEAGIAASIYDKADDPALNGVVDYDPWLTAQPVRATSWGVIKALFKG